MVGFEPTTDTAYKAAALTAELHPEYVSLGSCFWEQMTYSDMSVVGLH